MTPLQLSLLENNISKGSILWNFKYAPLIMLVEFCQSTRVQRVVLTLKHSFTKPLSRLVKVFLYSLKITYLGYFAEVANTEL
jgi:hypothetical protein